LHYGGVFEKTNYGLDGPWVYRLLKGLRSVLLNDAEFNSWPSTSEKILVPSMPSSSVV